MMDTITPFLTYSMALAIAVVIPGPGIAALVGHSLGGNLRASFLFVFGMALGDIVYLTVAVVGLAAVAQSFAGAFLVIKGLGGLYLLYLAYKFATSERGLATIQARRDQSGGAACLAGLLVTLGNPKTVIFYLALLPTFLNLDAVHLSQWATLAVLNVVILFAMLSPYAVLASKARAMMTRPAALRRLNRLASATIGGAAVLILGQAALAVAQRT